MIFQKTSMKLSQILHGSSYALANSKSVEISFGEILYLFSVFWWTVLTVHIGEKQLKCEIWMKLRLYLENHAIIWVIRNKDGMQNFRHTCLANFSWKNQSKVAILSILLLKMAKISNFFGSPRFTMFLVFWSSLVTSKIGYAEKNCPYLRHF